MKKDKRVIAIDIADVHLSHRPPPARAAETDWYFAMQRPLKELRRLEKKYNAPVLINGDLFDQAHPPEELIVFAMQELPKNVYSVCGNHDLPHHNYENMNKSGYGILAECGRIHDIEPHSNLTVMDEQENDKFQLAGFPCGADKPKPRVNRSDVPLIAVIHDYCWLDENSTYDTKMQNTKVPAWRKKLTGYDVACFGDNHSPHWKMFQLSNGKHQSIVNPGTFFRRRIDEIDHRPMAMLIYSDCSIEPYYFDCTEDKFIDPAKELGVFAEVANFDELVSELQSMVDRGLDFVESLKQFMNRMKLTKEVRTILLKAIEAALKKD